jgi:hypothetical protein
MNQTYSKVKVKVRPVTGPAGPRGEWRYRSTHSWTSAQGGNGVASPMPQPLYPWERNPVPIVQEAGWAPGLVWTAVENLASTRIWSPDRPAHSESLYQLHYLGPHHTYSGFQIMLCFKHMLIAPVKNVITVLKLDSLLAKLWHSLLILSPVFTTKTESAGTQCNIITIHV